MTSNELVEFYETVLSQLELLQDYTAELSKHMNAINGYNNDILYNLYPSGVGNNDITNKLNSIRNNLVTYVQNFAIAFNVLDYHKKLIDVDGKLKEYFGTVKHDSFSEEIKVIDILMQQYFSTTDSIYEYVRSRNISSIVALINQIKDTINDYNKVISNYSFIKSYTNKTENNIPYEENIKEIEFQLYDDTHSLSEIVVSLDSFNACYEELCRIFNISYIENQLRIVKVESGSLFGKFFGAEQVIEALGMLLKKIIDLIFSKFTYEGQILRHKEALEILKSDAEILAMYKGLGITLDIDSEDINKCHLTIIKSIQKLIGNNTHIKIDNKDFNITDNLKDRYLAESKNLLLEEKNDNSDAKE